jgi:hypothetical protein
VGQGSEMFLETPQGVCRQSLLGFLSDTRGESSASVNLVDELMRATRHGGPWRSRHLPTALRILVSAGELDKAESFAADIDVTATRDLNCVLTGQAILAGATTVSSSRRGKLTWGWLAA